MKCGYCDRPIADGEKMYLAREPYRAPAPAHESCGNRRRGEQPRVELIPKRLQGEMIVDPQG